MHSSAVTLALLCALIDFVQAARLRNSGEQPLTDAELRATGDTGYPCVASGPMIEVCNWYQSFVAENPKPPKSLKEPFIFGGEHTWHGEGGGDADVIKACEANYNTICVQKHPLCDEYFDMC